MDKAAELLGDEPLERRVEKTERRVEKVRTGTPAKTGRKPDGTCAFCVAEGFPGGHPPEQCFMNPKSDHFRPNLARRRYAEKGKEPPATMMMAVGVDSTKTMSEADKAVVDEYKALVRAGVCD